MLFYLEVDIIPLIELRMDKCINTYSRADSIASQHNSIFFIKYYETSGFWYHG